MIEVEVEVVLQDPRWAGPDLEALAPAAVAAALDAAGAAWPAEVAVLGCDDAEIARLNAARGEAGPTDVLSWPAHSLTPGQRPSGPFAGSLGDIALAYDTCARQAAALGLPLRDHALHLVVHGTLHLLGHDHATPDETSEMRRREVLALAKLGVADPY